MQPCRRRGVTSAQWKGFQHEQEGGIILIQELLPSAAEILDRPPAIERSVTAEPQSGTAKCPPSWRLTSVRDPKCLRGRHRLVHQEGERPERNGQIDASHRPLPKEVWTR